MIKFGTWFRCKATDMKWLEESPANRVARCDRKWNHIVPSEAPRLLVDSGKGPKRKRGRGKQHEYLCAACALLVYGLAPPSSLDDNQEKLF